MTIYFGESQVIEGSAAVFTNGAIESAIIHCRAILEFIGLGVNQSGTTLQELSRANQKKDDVVIEMIDGMKRMTVAEALSMYSGQASEAEKALVHVAYLANKGLAHTTTAFTKCDQSASLVEIAFRGIPTIVVNRFYTPLGIRPPDYKLQSWKR